MYTHIDFKTKKALREAVEAGEIITIFQPGPFGKDPESYEGIQYLEGPHYPAAHSWYAKVDVRHGVVQKVYK